MRSIALAAMAAAALSGCIETIAENKVESALLRAGLSERNSACMAERMVDRLTISQLRKLEQLRGKPGEPVRPRSLRQFVERVRAVGDGEVLAVTSTSAALCASGLADEARRD